MRCGARRGGWYARCSALNSRRAVDKLRVTTLSLLYFHKKYLFFIIYYYCSENNAIFQISATISGGHYWPKRRMQARHFAAFLKTKSAVSPLADRTVFDGHREPISTV